MPAHGAQRGAFVLMAIAYSLPYTVITSMLASWTRLFGPHALLWVSLAFYVPSIPLLSAGLLLDGSFDSWYGLQTANLVRALAGFGGSATLLSAIPFLPLRPGGSPWPLLGVVAGTGVFCAAAFGASFQLASCFPSQSTAALALGSVLAPPLLLAVEAGLQTGPRCPRERMALLFAISGALTLAGLGGALRVLRRLQHGAAAEGGSRGRGSGGLELAEEEEAAVPLLAAGELERLAVEEAVEGETGVLGQPAVMEPLEPGPPELGGRPPPGRRGLASAWPAAAALAVSLSTSQLLFPLLPFARSAGQFGELLPQVLFWTRCLADAAARVVPRTLPRPGSLLALSLAKAALVPLAFLHLSDRLPASDPAVVAYVAVQWLLSGFVNSAALQLGPRLVAPHLARTAASAMSLVFQTASLAGLLAAIPLQALALPAS